MIKNIEIEIPEGNPFKECKQYRLPIAQILESIFSNTRNGAVISINGDWGSGKTTFIRMFSKYLEEKEYKTILFNAWENDFTSDPLIAIMGELNQHIKSDPSLHEKFQAVTRNVIKAIIPSVVKSISKKYLGEDAADIFEKGTEAISDAYNKEISEYAEKKASLNTFRENLSSFIKEYSPDKPLVFFVDELDRCRPDYAVETLEKIKHLFSIEGVIFVLAIDKEQLCHSVKGFYGSEGINAEEYLRRFIDLEYTLPSVGKKEYIEMLMNNYQITQFFNNPDRIKHFSDSDEYKTFIEMATHLSLYQNMTLRQIDKLLKNCAISLKSVPKNHFLYPDIFLFLTCLKQFNSIKYKQICSKELTIQDTVDFLENIFEKRMINNDGDDSDKRPIYSFVSEFVHRYNNLINTDLFDKKSLISNNEIIFKTSILDKERLFDIISYLSSSRYSRNSFQHVITKIDLLDQLIEK